MFAQTFPCDFFPSLLIAIVFTVSDTSSDVSEQISNETLMDNSEDESGIHVKTRQRRRIDRVLDGSDPGNIPDSFEQFDTFLLNRMSSIRPS